MYLSTQRRMVWHGAAVLLIALIAGLGLIVSLVGGVELIPGQIVPVPIFGDPSAWARAHVGGILNALLVFVIALLLPILGFGEKGTDRIAWSFIGAGWANSLFYWAALFAPNRGLTLGPNRLGAATVASWIGFVPALIFAVVALVAVVGMIVQARAGARLLR